jgi:hypothetical protein
VRDAAVFWISFQAALESLDDPDAPDPQLPWVQAELRKWVTEKIEEIGVA